ncbi:MAG TPA: molybdopterin molybdotransferase MoeA [Gudongella oleilytica]|nr:molybdopterin molybdotransferase MoeA [Gudongella oleilytica]
MEFFKVSSVEDARKLVLDEFSGYTLQSEELELEKTTGRTLSEDVVSEEDVPGFDRSTVDGYAIVAEDSHGATDSIPSLLMIKGEVRMGEEAALTIKNGETVYVPTGGMIPKGATAMVMIENTEKMDDNTLLIYKPVSVGENILFKGEDVRVGQTVLRKGYRLTPQGIGVLASLGITKAKVYKKPRVHIISTGDEIIEIRDKLDIGKIRDINSYSIGSLVESLGGEISGRVIIGDDYDQLLKGVLEGLEKCDILILSGGSSVGTRDYTYQVIEALGGKGVLIHGLAIKPGKPTIVGDGRGKLVVGLPGHPVSSIVVFKAIVEPFIRSLMNREDILPQVRALVTQNFPSSPGKETYHMVRLDKEHGEYLAIPSFGKSGMITLLSGSQGYIVIKEHEEGVNKGELRDVFLI